MGLADMLLNAHGGGAAELLAQRFGISPQQAASAVTALTPALASGIRQNAANEGGLQSLLGALLGGQHQQYVENAESVGQPDTIADGNAILGHVLGSKDVSRQVASQASAQTGLGADLGVPALVAGLALGALRLAGLDPLASYLPLRRRGSGRARSPSHPSPPCSNASDVRESPA